MKVKKLMTEEVKTCRAYDSLCVPAGVMWDQDCGFVPVVDDGNRVIGVITDRDICMAAYTQGRALDSIPTRTAMANKVFLCRPQDSIQQVEHLMDEQQIRRVPVVDDEKKLVGVVSLSDIARASVRGGSRGAADVTVEEMATVLAGVCRPRTGRPNFVVRSL